MVRLMQRCTRLWFGVAWAGSDHQVFESLIDHRKKIGTGVIGTHRCCTSPDAIDAFEGSETVRMREPDGSLFHPKLYLFELEDRGVIVTGSHNLTMSAYHRNIEAGITMDVEKDGTIYREVRKLLKAAWRESTHITRKVALGYRLLHNANRPQRIPRTLVLPKLASTFDPYDKLLFMDWPTYLRRLMDVKAYGVHDRLTILDEAHRIATDVADRRRSDPQDMRLFAGTAGHKEDDGDWGLFGRMTGFGVMKKLVNENRQAFVTALLRIPRQGEVREADYKAFCRRFTAAFAEEARTGGIASASRLLTLWRPDVFVPYNEANKRGIASALGIARSAVNLDTYWQLVIERTQAAPWWQGSRPVHVFAGRVWDYRAAMLDTLYYQPA